MKFAFLQKVSLQDFPDTISCIIFIAGCSFRCPACYNAEILDLQEEKISEKEILDFLEKRKSKLDGVVISGGEPLINPEIISFLEKIKEKEYKIKIDTNGSNPNLLKEIIDKRLVNYIAMDVKSPREIYEKVAGVKIDLEKIEESMKIIVNSGIDFEFRTTLVPVIDGEIREMNENDVEKISEWISKFDKNAKFFLQPFIPAKERLLNSELEKFSTTKEEILKKSRDAAKKFLFRVYIRV